MWTQWSASVSGRLALAACRPAWTREREFDLFETESFTGETSFIFLAPSSSSSAAPRHRPTGDGLPCRFSNVLHFKYGFSENIYRPPRYRETVVLVVLVFFMAIIFLPCGFFLSIFYLSIFFSSPNLSGHRLDVYHTSTHGVALVRI